MRAAALALEHGVGLDYLRITDPVEQIVVDHLLQEAEDEKAKRWKSLMDGIEVAVHNGVSSAFRR